MTTREIGLLLPEEKPDDVRFLKEQLRSIDRNKIIITSSKGKWVTVLGVVLGVVLLCVLLAIGYLVYRLKYVRPPSNVNVKFDRKNSEVIVDPGRVSCADQGSQGLPEPVANLLGSRMDLTRSRFIPDPLNLTEPDPASVSHFRCPPLGQGPECARPTGGRVLQLRPPRPSSP